MGFNQKDSCSVQPNIASRGEGRGAKVNNTTQSVKLYHREVPSVLLLFPRNDSVANVSASLLVNPQMWAF